MNGIASSAAVVLMLSRRTDVAAYAIDRHECARGRWRAHVLYVFAKGCFATGVCICKVVLCYGRMREPAGQRHVNAQFEGHVLKG